MSGERHTGAIRKRAGAISLAPPLPAISRSTRLLIPAKEMSCAVPTGLRGTYVESAIPTLKRGADNHCACGAAARTLPARPSMTPAPAWDASAAPRAAHFLPATASPAIARTGKPAEPQPDPHLHFQEIEP